MSVDLWFKRLEILNASIVRQQKIINDLKEDLRVAELVLKGIEKDKFFITQELEKKQQWNKQN